MNVGSGTLHPPMHQCDAVADQDGDRVIWSFSFAHTISVLRPPGATAPLEDFFDLPRKVLESRASVTGGHALAAGLFKGVAVTATR
jgi:hypothetical protein